MKKILNIALATVVTFAMSGCQDFLDTSSPSVVDRDFVFSNEESARGHCIMVMKPFGQTEVFTM